MTEKKKRGRPPAKPKSNGNVDAMSKLYQPIRVVGAKRLYKTAEELCAKVNEYFEICAKEDRIPNKTRLTAFLGLRNTESLQNYHAYGDDYAEVIDKANIYIEAWLEESLINHRTNTSTVGVIFALKNHYGWTDRQEVRNEFSLEVMPRAALEQELERDFLRIEESRRKTEMVTKLISEPVETTEV